MKEIKGDSYSVNEVKEVQTNAFGPALPPNLVNKNSNILSCNDIGPSLPPCFSDSVDSNSSTVKQQQILIGPSLPPHLAEARENQIEPLNEPLQIIGPSLPGGFNNKVPSTLDPYLPYLSSIDEQAPCKSIDIHSNMSEEEIYGPLPVENHQLSSSRLALEERALQLKIDKLDPKLVEPTREDWMLKLPEHKALNFGLGPRQFRKSAGPDMSDRSSWTNIPGKSKNEVPQMVDLSKETESKQIAKRDQEQEILSKKYKRKEKKSLLDMHTNKIKKNKKDNDVNERRPFSREVDLQVNRFDEVQKKAILKKAQLLDDRFSSGQSKFL